MSILLVYLFYAVILSIVLGRAGHRSRPVPTRESLPSDEPAGRFRRILIVGATGGTGRHLVERALERGYEVTALVRNPSKLTIEHSRLTVVQGDVLDPSSLDAAVAGQDAVLSALGHSKYFYPTRILSDGTACLLEAMHGRGVSRFVCETSIGIGDSTGKLGVYYTFFTIPIILPFYYWDKTRQERIIERSNSEWVIVRPGLLKNSLARGRYRYGSDVGSFLWSVGISRADVADFMLDQLESDECLGAAVSVAW